MTEQKEPLVVQVINLAAFREEVPAPDLVRLLLTEQNTSHQLQLLGLQHLFDHDGTSISAKLVALNLQGVNARGEIVWLHWSAELRCYPSHDGKIQFMSPGVESIYDLLIPMHDLVRGYLEKCEYTVRRSQYGVPDFIQPIRGEFECVRFVKEKGLYRLTSGDSCS